MSGARIGHQPGVIHDPRARAFEAMAQLLVSETSLAGALSSVLAVVTDTIPAAAHAGLTTGDAHGNVATPIFTDPEVPDMDQAQYDAGRGPCLDAWREGKVVRLDDLTWATDRYPEFVAAAAAHGISSTLSVPLVADSASLGAINLYSPGTATFTEDDERLLADIGPAAGAFLANAQAYWHAFALSEQLNDALTSRAVIDQAKGILMAGNPQLDADGAFAILRSASRRENVKLRDIAQRIIDRRPPPGV
jgi:GAF domain-containing protein